LRAVELFNAAIRLKLVSERSELNNNDGTQSRLLDLVIRDVEDEREVSVCGTIVRRIRPAVVPL
jgi:hypothetical protein